MTSARRSSTRQHQVPAATTADPGSGTRPPSVRASSRSSHGSRPQTSRIRNSARTASPTDLRQTATSVATEP